MGLTSVLKSVSSRLFNFEVTMGCGSSTGPSSPQTTRRHAEPYPKQQGAGQGKPVANVQPQKPKNRRNSNSDSETEIETKPVKLDKKTVEKYCQLEKETKQYENQNILKSIQVKNQQLEELNNTVKQLQDHYNNCVQQTAKEKADVDNMNVKNFLDQATFDEKMSKEQEEYLDALNRQEVAKKELDGVTNQRDKVTKERDELKKQEEKLVKIYKEQDELLASIFNGKYGSEEEYRLESELDVCLDKKQRISVANYKWSNARILLQHAVSQLGVAVKKWTDILTIQPGDTQKRYVTATEARNNLIAANQNITSAQRYLNNITFPYCKQDEMKTLDKAVANIYTDMQTKERHDHALQCYVTTHKRAAALLQWFDHVINNVITKDLKKATTEANQKNKELRKERHKLIKQKIGEQNDKDNTGLMSLLDVFDDKRDDDDKDDKNLADECLKVDVQEADNVSQAGDIPAAATADGEQSAAGGSDSSAPTPLPASELAAAPTTEDIFGDISDLKKQHEQDMEEFKKTQELNKARMQQGLEEKLRARRSRRQRQARHEAQAQAIGTK